MRRNGVATSSRARATRVLDFRRSRRSRVASTKRAAAGSARIWDASWPSRIHSNSRHAASSRTGGSFVSSNASRASKALRYSVDSTASAASWGPPTASAGGAAGRVDPKHELLHRFSVRAVRDGDDHRFDTCQMRAGARRP